MAEARKQITLMIEDGKYYIKTDANVDFCGHTIGPFGVYENAAIVYEFALHCFHRGSVDGAQWVGREVKQWIREGCPDPDTRE